MAPPKRPRRLRDPEGAREAILDAALKRFSRCGYRGARIADIAKDAACSEALVYFHFKSKAELFRETVNRIDSDSAWFHDDDTHDGLIRTMHDGELRYHRDARWRALDHVWSEAQGGERDLLELLRPQMQDTVARLDAVLGKFDEVHHPRRRLFANLLQAVSYGSRVMRRYDADALTPEDAADLLAFATAAVLQALEGKGPELPALTPATDAPAGG